MLTEEKCEERVAKVRANRTKRLKAKNIEIRKLKRELKACKENKPEPPKPNGAIKSFEVRDGKFIINGQPTKLYGVSKREQIVVGSGEILNASYSYVRIKRAILDSNTNYIRVFAGNNLNFFRQEVKDYLKHGKIVHVELYDAGNPSRQCQAYWLDTFNAVKDLPVFFDAHNEFKNYEAVDYVVDIIEYVIDHGGIISAGAWSGSKGKRLVKQFKEKCDAYQVVSHHREWGRRSLRDSMETGKPIIMDEIHTRDHTLQQIKDLFKSAFEWGCEGVNIYPLGNFDANGGIKFQKILDYVSEFRKKEE